MTEQEVIASGLAEIMTTMGPQGEWQVAPPATDRKAIRAAVEAMRPGMCWASGPHAGFALHCALCRGAGVMPTAPGVAIALAERLGLTRQGYYRLIRRGETLSVVNAATAAGLYAIALPPAEGSGSIRWVIGDQRMEVSP